MRGVRTIEARTLVGDAVGLAVAALIAGAAIGGATQAPAQGRYYVGKSPGACETIDYACPSGWTAFHDEHGCGCVRPPPDSGRQGAV